MTWDDAKCSVPNIAKRLTIKIPMTRPSGNFRAYGDLLIVRNTFRGSNGNRANAYHTHGNCANAYAW